MIEGLLYFMRWWFLYGAAADLAGAILDWLLVRKKLEKDLGFHIFVVYLGPISWIIFFISIIKNIIRWTKND
jgi:hypothetical protein